VRVFSTSGRGHFGPGEWSSGDPGTIGAVAFQRDVPETLRTLPLDAYRQVCGREADWVEVVGP
jgi:hypothetical protein